MPQAKGSALQGCPHFRCPFQVQVVTLASDQPAMNCKFQFHPPPRPTPSGQTIGPLLEWCTELRKTIYFLDYCSIMKGHNSDSQLEEMHRAWYGEGCGVSMPSPGTSFLQHFCVLSSLGAGQMPSLGVFIEASSRRHH